MRPKAILRNTVETEKDVRARMAENLDKEMQKLRRDIKCGGVRGNHYVALNYRVKY